MIRHYATTPEHKKLPLQQITTKINTKNFHRIQELKNWFENQGVTMNQQQIVDDLLTYAFNSTEIALKIDDKPFSYAEIVEPIDKVYEDNRLTYKNGMEEWAKKGAKDGYEFLINDLMVGLDVEDVEEIASAFESYEDNLAEYLESLFIKERLSSNLSFDKLSKEQKGLIEDFLPQALKYIEEKIEALK